MAESGKIIWLASYPKSGNTWLRLFLANLKSNDNKPVDINDLKISSIASSRVLFDEYAGLSSSDLSSDEIDRMRPYIYDEISENSSEAFFLKIHDAYTYTSEGRPLVSEKASYKAIYIIRNPLDVAVSFAHHLGVKNEKSVAHMNNESYVFGSNNTSLGNQLEQKLLSWSLHVKSWTKQTSFPVLVLRYEDMKSNPFETFQKAVSFSGLDYNDQKIEQAIKNSSFEELQKQEKLAGFKEKPLSAEFFFRKGETDSWKNELEPHLVDQIINIHFEVMKQYNYLP